MSTYSKKAVFGETQAGVEARRVLTAMAADASFKTDASYSANATLYPDNTISFVEKHMEYLRVHPATDPQQYLSNLRLMTRLK